MESGPASQLTAVHVGRVDTVHSAGEEDAPQTTYLLHVWEAELEYKDSH